MDREKFIECEYLSLRDEIKTTKDRIFKLAGIGLIGMPSAYSVAKINDIQALVLSLPLLIGIITLLYLSESRALMRCGTYIKKVIEPEINISTNNENSILIGWEHWLSAEHSGEPDRRAVDKFLSIFFYLLFVFYYVASVHLAVTSANKLYGMPGLAVSLGIYVGTGIIFIVFLAINFKTSTRTLS